MTIVGRIGKTTLDLPPMGFGTVPIGGQTAEMTDPQALQTLETAWRGGLRYFDTAPWYGLTQSEHRLGIFLRSKPREQFHLTTKVGRVMKRPASRAEFESSRWRARWPGGLSFEPHFDYSYDSVLRSYEDSLTRMGLNRIDGLAIHDLDTGHHGDQQSVAKGFDQLDVGGGYRALEQLKSSREIQAIGAGINMIGMIPQFLERFPIDYFIVAMPYTLADQEALAEELPLCAQVGASVIIGAPFASGILATGATSNARYRYGPAPDDVKSKVAKIQTICRRYGVPLAAAALQFPLAHSAVVSIIPGAETSRQVDANLEAFVHPIPDEFWEDLKNEGLLHIDAPVPKNNRQML